MRFSYKGFVTCKSQRSGPVGLKFYQAEGSPVSGVVLIIKGESQTFVPLLSTQI